MNPPRTFCTSLLAVTRDAKQAVAWLECPSPVACISQPLSPLRPVSLGQGSFPEHSTMAGSTSLLFSIGVFSKKQL